MHAMEGGMTRLKVATGRQLAVTLAFGLAIQMAGTARGAVAAAIVLRPSVGPPTLPFNVKGSGFGASETVDLTFDATLIGTATTSPAGAFKRRVAVPATATPGGHTVTATGEHSGFTATAGFLVRTNWARFHFDDANTGFNPFENVISASNVGSLVQKWAVPTYAGWAPDPIVAYGRMYVAPADGIVRALDPATGALLWSFATSGGTYGAAPTAANGLIYVGNNIGQLFALSASTGQPVWSRDDLGPITGSPVVGSGALYVGGTFSGMSALDALTGATIWNEPTAAYGRSPTLAEGMVLTASYDIDCVVEARDATTGSFDWYRSFCLEFNSTTMPVADGIAFDYSLGVNAVDATSGADLWHFYPGGSNGGPPLAVANDTVYGRVANGYPDPNSHLFAVNESTGSLKWSVPLRGLTLSSPAVANGVVYVGSGAGGSQDGSLYAFDASTGALLWNSPAAATTFDASPAVSDGMVFASTQDGTVYAFGLP
jgi:outer membrane protein assembly factor BamB